MSEHPVQQPIRAIDIDTIPEVQGGYVVGRNGVTRIEACEKSGMHSSIPYVRVWAGEQCEAEFCQHNIVGVYFQRVEPAPTAEEIARWKAAGIGHIVNGTCVVCERPSADCDCLPF